MAPPHLRGTAQPGGVRTRPCLPASYQKEQAPVHERIGKGMQYGLLT